MDSSECLPYETRLDVQWVRFGSIITSSGSVSDCPAFRKFLGASIGQQRPKTCYIIMIIIIIKVSLKTWTITTSSVCICSVCNKDLKKVSSE